MQAEPTAAARRQRLTGVDAARGLALIGMMAVHFVRLAVDPAGPVVYAWAAGRSAALFAVLAGVGISLASGGVQPRHGAALWSARRAVAARAAVVTMVGLALGQTDTTLLVILPYYGLLFLVAVPVLGWGAGRLTVLAAVAAVTTPIISHILRAPGGQVIADNPRWAELLAEPLATARVLLLTGTYPVLTWSTYLFAGMAVGRLALGRSSVGGAVAVLGGGMALAGWAAGEVTLAVVGRARVAADLPGGVVPTGALDNAILNRFFGAPPATDWWWLGIRAPHIGTTPDLVHTTGTALLILGVCLLLVPRAGSFARPLVAAGAMTLTLYSAHVLTLSAIRDQTDGVPELWVFAGTVGTALVVATVWGSPRRRGPLEALSASAARWAAGAGRAQADQ